MTLFWSNSISKGNNLLICETLIIISIMKWNSQLCTDQGKTVEIASSNFSRSICNIRPRARVPLLLLMKGSISRYLNLWTGNPHSCRNNCLSLNYFHAKQNRMCISCTQNKQRFWKFTLLSNTENLSLFNGPKVWHFH